MSELKIRAIVLKSINYKESDKLVTLFSVENGKITCNFKGVCKPKAKLAYACQPFCFGEYLLAEKNGFYTGIGCDAQDSFFYISSDIERFYYGASLLEICNCLVKENEPNPALFIALLKCLKLLCYEKDCVPLAVLVKFLLDCLKISGYAVRFDLCNKCCSKNINRPFFNYNLGGAVCFSCADNYSVELKSGEFAILKLLSTSDIDMLKNYKFTSKINLLECMKLLVRFFQDKTGERLRSIEQISKIISV